jgi:phage gpG-like protein
LRSSISWRVDVDALGAYADVGSNVEYAAFVELGTDRMAARPYLRPALVAARF